MQASIFIGPDEDPHVERSTRAVVSDDPADEHPITVRAEDGNGDQVDLYLGLADACRLAEQLRNACLRAEAIASGAVRVLP